MTVGVAPGGIEAFLAKSEQRELVRFLTCGSVDDGKSTLIGRLLFDSMAVYEDQLAAVRRDSERTGRVENNIDLSLLTDGLRAEREQGITIDVAYRYFATEKRKFIIADTPGHEQYTRNMATGASTCDLAVILVDARQGVLQQTRRHSFIASLLGIRHVVVAVNKMDLVGYSEEVFDRIRHDYSEFAAKLELRDLRFIPVSALHGDNVVMPSTNMHWYAGETLLYYLDTVHIASDRNLIDFRLPVQYVLRPHQDFRGLSGTVASGVIRTGDEIVVLPSGARSRVASIVTADGVLDEAFSPMAVTLTLTDDVDVVRGDLLVHPNNLPRVERVFEAMVVWMGEQPLVAGRQYWIKHTTSMVPAAVTSIRYRIDVNTLHRTEASGLAMNDIGRCQISAARPLALDGYRRNRATGAFILIDRLTNGTVGAGMIVERGTSDQSLRDYWQEERPDAGAETATARVTRDERAARYGQNPITLLLTGLSGSGKTSVARALERRLFGMGRAVSVLDGREMRRTISPDLGFSAPERSENLRRAMGVARLMNEAGLICICAFVAPSRAVRRRARRTVGVGRFAEVYLSAPLEVCRARDPEGLYTRAEAGEVGDVPGLSAPYEPPENAELTLSTDVVGIEECVDRIVEWLEAGGYLHT
jgi:bifunctional enzyme CysN/CysC